jgi:hypothetical protein
MIASFGVCANLSFYKIIGNLRLQNDETVNFSQADMSYLVLIIPIEYLN